MLFPRDSRRLAHHCLRKELRVRHVLALDRTAVLLPEKRVEALQGVYPALVRTIALHADSKILRRERLARKIAPKRLQSLIDILTRIANRISFQYLSKLLHAPSPPKGNANLYPVHIPLLHVSRLCIKFKLQCGDDVPLEMNAVIRSVKNARPVCRRCRRIAFTLDIEPI